MKKSKSELIKIQNIIENNRIKTDKSFFELMTTDICKLLKDYFVFNKIPLINIINDGGEYFVTIKLPFLRIKNFSTLSR